MENIIKNIAIEISNDVIIKVLIVALIFDIFLGSLRAIKKHKWNSTVGINGILRKIAMVGSVIFLFITDKIVNFNLIGFIPEELLNFINIKTIGCCQLFGIMYILYEITSILKNMVICELPVPKGIRKKVKSLLENMTTELDNKK